LHWLREGEGRALLWVHGLGQRAPRVVPTSVAGWPGPVAALDLTGHGQSTVPRGGGYHPEVLLFDVDAALHAMGTATLVGRGLGAYVAVLAAGARPKLVRGAILLDGPGIEGGGPFPASGAPIQGLDGGAGVPDPFALYELTRDPRPPEYVELFVKQAAALSGLSTPVFVCAKQRPEWLARVLELPGAEQTKLGDALERAARSA
jgi:pimeloyl-ACP methyl ester carboxylesterase